MTFPDELLAQVPEAARNLACICRGCVEAALRRRKPPKPGPGDFYFDAATGYLVFNDCYHRRRGYCCDSGCRHCPWRPPEGGTAPPTVGGAVRTDTTSALLTRVATVLCLLWLALPGAAATRTEDFSTDPTQRGWQSHGNADLFRWDPDGQWLAVTWDTANPHSFFALPLTTVLTAGDDFAVDFDLRISGIRGGARTNRPGAMPLSIGFLNLSRALTNSYQRGAGRARDTLEFTWFPTGEIPGFGEVDPTVSAITWDSAGKVAASFTFPVEPTIHTAFHVRLAYRSSNRTLTPSLIADGAAVPLNPLRLPESFGSFELNALAVMVWNEATSLSDSLFAQATLDNIALEVPPAPIGHIRLIGSDQVECDSLPGWRYHLEASDDLIRWSVVGTETGTGAPLLLADVRDAVFREQFYRVQAIRE